MERPHQHLLATLLASSSVTAGMAGMATLLASSSVTAGMAGMATLLASSSVTAGMATLQAAVASWCEEFASRHSCSPLHSLKII